MFNFDILIRQASENGLTPKEVMNMSHRQYTNFIVGQIRLLKAQSKRERINNVLCGYYSGLYSGNYKNVDKPSQIINGIINEDSLPQHIDVEEQKRDIKNILFMHKNWK